jgi:hypothetical protein
MVRLLVLFFWSCLCAAALFRAAGPVNAQGPNNCLECHSRQKDDFGQVVAIYRTSTHYLVTLGCDACHGGDSSESERSKAHAGRFIARPDSSGTLEMCGKCHRQPLEFFKSSRHFADRANVKRLDCVECHGVHAIGAASESFRWPQFCAGCHGLEYLPPLPKAFQEMLALSDDLREGLHRLETKGSVHQDLDARRKEIRHMISELVHQTDARAGLERIPRILELGAGLKQQIASEEKR